MDAYSKIVRYIEEDLASPPGTKPRDPSFEKLSYSRWAAYEILERIMDRPLDPPESIVEEFIIEMVMYSRAYTPLKNKRFKIAQKAAEDILHLINEEGG